MGEEVVLTRSHFSGSPNDPCITRPALDFGSISLLNSKYSQILLGLQYIRSTPFPSPTLRPSTCHPLGFLLQTKVSPPQDMEFLPIVIPVLRFPILLVYIPDGIRFSSSSPFYSYLSVPLAISLPGNRTWIST